MEEKCAPANDVVVVRFPSRAAERDAILPMAQLGEVTSFKSGNTYINKSQLEELKRLKIPHTLVFAPPSCKEIRRD
jgi:hypothetical protein